MMADLSDAESPRHHLWKMVNHPLVLRTAAFKQIRKQEAQSLTHTPEAGKDAEQALDLQICLSACFKSQKTTHASSINTSATSAGLNTGKPFSVYSSNSQKRPRG